MQNVSNPNREFYCRICQRSVTTSSFLAKEMMFGLKTEFEYFECSNCGCVQILEIPQDLDRFYPGHYYSLQRPSRLKFLLKGAWLSEKLTPLLMFKRLCALLPGVRMMPEWIYLWGVEKKASVLEIGCGSGSKLMEMSAVGYTRLTGIDPFLSSDTETPNGIKLHKKNLEEMTGSFDAVMLHHSFEHMPAQQKTLDFVYRMLNPGGKLLIRVPLADSFGFKTYGPNWVQLDPPRHLFLHTKKSLTLLANASGFILEKINFDSTDFQFWGSEQYAQGTPLLAENSYLKNPRKSIFSSKDIGTFLRKAKALNENQQGDQAAFYFRKDKTNNQLAG